MLNCRLYYFCFTASLFLLSLRDFPALTPTKHDVFHYCYYIFASRTPSKYYEFNCCYYIFYLTHTHSIAVTTLFVLLTPTKYFFITYYPSSTKHELCVELTCITSVLLSSSLLLPFQTPVHRLSISFFAFSLLLRTLTDAKRIVSVLDAVRLSFLLLAKVRARTPSKQQKR